MADAFLVAWRRFDDLPTDAEEAWAWLFGIAQRTLLNGQRGNRRRRALTIRIADATVVAQSGEAWKGSDSELVARRLDLAAVWCRLAPVHQEASAWRSGMGSLDRRPQWFSVSFPTRSGSG